MAKEIVSVLKVNTGDSEKTIKGLREEIKSLKTQLESAEIGSDKFTKASNDLAKAQNELKKVMDSTKQTVKAADGSYDALVATMAELKKEWKSTNDEIKRSEIGEKINEINTQLKELDASIGNAQRNVGNYKADFVDAMTEMQTGAFDFGKEMGDMNKKTEVTRTALDGVGQVASGLASGFAAVQGVTALMGIENKNLEKTFVQVQSAMAIAQGIGGMKGLVEGAGKLITAYKAAKMGSAAMATQTNATTVAMGTTATATNVATGALHTFKAALISTGVGALIVALGTLIGYLVTLGDESENTKGDIDDMTDSLKDFKEEMSKIEFEQQWNIRFMKAGGASEKEILDQELKDAQKNWNKALHNENDLRDSLAVATRNYKANPENEDLKNLKDTLEKAVKAAEELTKERNQKIKEANNAILEYDIKVTTKAKEKKIKAAEELAKAEAEAAKKRKAEAEAIAEEARKALIDTKEEELAELEKIYLKKKDILEKEGKDTTNLTKAYEKSADEVIKKYKQIDAEGILKLLNKNLKESSSSLTSNEKNIENSYALKGADATSEVELIQLEIDKTLELQAIREQAFNEQMAQIKAILDAEKEKDILSAEQEEELRQRYADIETQKVQETANANTQIQLLNKELVAQQKLNSKEIAQYTTQAFSTALSSASQLLNAIEANMDKSTEEGFERSKKMRIASATMSTLEGIIGAWTSAMSLPAPFSYIIGGIQSAATAALGGVQIAAIKKEKFDGGGSSDISGAAATPSINMAESMPVQYTRELLTDSETDIINQPVKCYVLESDISDTQNKVKVSESNATF